MFRIAFDPIFAHPLPEGHRFPMLKYELLPQQLMYEGTIREENLFAPPPLEEEILLLTHDPVYWQRMKNLELSAAEMRKIGFPLSPELVERELRIMRGTVDAALFALQHGVAMNVAGGTHHAYADRGEGFCLLNDLAITANYLLEAGLARRILIIDLDVHQGNGTAALMKDNPSVFTFSMHGKDNYPLHKEKSDLDVELPTGITDAAYLQLLEKHLGAILEQWKPDFALFQSGVDILETDRLGKLKLSRAGCMQRDRYVLEEMQRRQLPVVAAMGGGYSPIISDIVEAHCNTFRLAARIFF